MMTLIYGKSKGQGKKINKLGFVMAREPANLRGVYINFGANINFGAKFKFYSPLYIQS